MNKWGGALTPCEYPVSHSTFFSLPASICVDRGFFYSVGYSLLLDFISSPNHHFGQGKGLCSRFCVLAMYLWSFEHFFAFWHENVFQAHLVPSFSHPWYKPFLHFSPVPLSEKSFGNQGVVLRWAHCCWGVAAPRLPQWTELGNRCAHLSACLSVSLYICLSLSLSLSISLSNLSLSLYIHLSVVLTTKLHQSLWFQPISPIYPLPQLLNIFL